MSKSKKVSKSVVCARPSAVCDHSIGSAEEGERLVLNWYWSIVESHGTTVAKLTRALRQETPLLYDEIAKIRLEDVRVIDRVLFVRAQKTITASWVKFGEKTEQHLWTWLSERDTSVNHGRLLHRPDRRPFTGSSLLMEIGRSVAAGIEAQALDLPGDDGEFQGPLKPARTQAMFLYLAGHSVH